MNTYKIYDGHENLDFGTALSYLKKGFKIKRKHWGGYWVIDEVGIDYDPSTMFYDDSFEMIIAKLKDGGYAPAQAYQGDLLANDWEVIE